MTQRLLRQQAIDLLAFRLRWIFIAAAGLLAWDTVPMLLLAPVIVGQVASNFLAARLCANFDFYKTKGNHVASGLRLIDGLLIASAAFFTRTQADPVWLLALPIVCVEGIASRDWRRTAVLAAVIAGVQAGGMLSAGKPMNAVAVPVLALGCSPILALVLASYRSQEETYKAHDQRLAAMMASASALANSQDLRSMMLQTLKSAVTDLGATAGFVVIENEEEKSRLITEAAFCRSGEFDFPTEVRVGEGISGYVAKMGQPISIHDNGGERLECDGVSVRVRSAVSVPITARSYVGPGSAPLENVIGAMTIVNSENADVVQGEDLELLQSLSSLIATAVTSARMEERQRATFLRTLESLATALEARDDYTRGHSQRVCELSLLIGQQLGLSSEALEELRIGTILHDIGKIGVPDAILNKPDRLTDEEFEFMKAHPVIGYEICKPLMLSEGVLMIIRNHHEKLDGTGYPDGLKGGELPLSLRIVCVADAFDAMSSRRPYRGVMDINIVLAEMSRCAGVQFDPVVVEVLKNLLHSGALDQHYEAYWQKKAEDLAA